MAITAPPTAASADVYNEFLDELLAQAPGAASAQVQRRLQDVIRTFLTKSTVWRVIMGPVSVVADTPTIDLNPPEAGLVIVAIHALTHTTRGLLRPASPIQAARLRTFDSSDFYTWQEMAPGQLYLTPTPLSAESNALTAFVSLTIDRDGTDKLPKFLMTHYYAEILAGCLAGLYMEPGRPYTNVAVAALNDRKFKSGIRSARSAADRGFQPTRASFSFPFWA